MAKRILSTYTPGMVFGRLVVVRDVGVIDRERRVDCRCECGKLARVRASLLKSGDTTSCGCWHRKRAAEAKRKHGYCPHGNPTKTYVVWQRMRARCERKTAAGFADYGGRGIQVCERWCGTEGFANFLADMGERPAGKSLDRINNHGNYEPGNVRWATAIEQANNKRNNVRLTLHGKTKTLPEWCREKQLNVDVVRQRLGKLKWTVERALTVPVR